MVKSRLLIVNAAQETRNISNMAHPLGPEPAEVTMGNERQRSEHHGLFALLAIGGSALLLVGGGVLVFGGGDGDGRSSVAEAVPGTELPIGIAVGSTVLTSTTERSAEEIAQQQELESIAVETEAQEDRYNILLGNIDGAKGKYDEAKSHALEAEYLIDDDPRVSGDKDLINGTEKDELKARIGGINTLADSASSQLDVLPIGIAQKVIAIEKLVAAGDIAAARIALGDLESNVSEVDGLISGAQPLLDAAKQLVADCTAALDRQVAGNGGSGSGGTGGNGGGTPNTQPPLNCRPVVIYGDDGYVIGVIEVCD